MGVRPSQQRAPISTRWALTQQELDFCRIYAGFGYTNATEAYRRAFFPDIRDPDTQQWREDPAKKGITAKAMQGRAAQLVGQTYVKKFLEELQVSGSDRAREILLEQAQFGDPATQNRAARDILAQEDKLGFRDAVEQYANIMCAIGAEVVVPVPGGGEIVIPFKEMFPRYREAMPPVEVLEKTERSLREYREKLVDDAKKEGEK